MDRLVIIGAGGHGRVVADIARASGRYKSILFLDDAFSEKSQNVLVVGKVEDFHAYIQDSEFVVAIGNNNVRKRVQQQLSVSGAVVTTLIHPSVIIGSDVRIDEGTVVMPGAIINSGTRIAEGVVVNTAASIDHDCQIESYAHVSVGAHLAGTVKIGKSTFVGAGAIIINNTSISDDCTIGAGAVVVKSIEKSGRYIGVPAKRR